MADASVTAAKTSLATGQQTWQAPIFLGTWTNYSGGFDTAGYMKDSLGFVHLKGLVKSGTSGSSIFILPAGYRPAGGTLIFPSVSSATTGTRVDVETSGNVKHNTGSTDFVSLNGITFKGEV